MRHSWIKSQLIISSVLLIGLAGGSSQAAKRVVITGSYVAGDAPATPAELDSDCANGIGTPQTMTQLRKQAFQMSVALNRPAADQVEKRVGHCFEADGQDNFANRQIRPWLMQEFTAHPPPKVTKEDGETATLQDWIAIDIMARTMMAEIGGAKACHQETDYTRALGRLVLNRTEQTSSTSPDVRSAFGGYWRARPGEKNATNPIVPVLLFTKQFAVWTGTDAANRWAACPSRSSPTWKKILKTAEDAILRPNAFRAVTEGMRDVLHYTGGSEAYDSRLCQGYTPIKNATIGGRVVGNPACMSVWEEPKRSEIPKPADVKACIQRATAARLAKKKS